MEAMRIFIISSIFLMLLINCYSSRDRCYPQNYESSQEFCEFTFLLRVNEQTGFTESRKKDTILVACLQAELQRKSCDSKTNLDVRN